MTNDFSRRQPLRCPLTYRASAWRCYQTSLAAHAIRLHLSRTETAQCDIPPENSAQRPRSTKHKAQRKDACTTSASKSNFHILIRTAPLSPSKYRTVQRNPGPRARHRPTKYHITPLSPPRALTSCPRKASSNTATTTYLNSKSLTEPHQSISTTHSAASRPPAHQFTSYSTINDRLAPQTSAQIIPSPPHSPLTAYTRADTLSSIAITSD